VDLHPDLDALLLPVIAKLAQARAGVARQVDECLAEVDLLAPRRRIGRLKLARGAVAEQAHLGPVESLLQLGAFGGGDRGLDSVLVAGAELDGGVPG